MRLHILSLNRHLYSTRRLIEEASQQGYDVQVLNYEHIAQQLQAKTSLSEPLPDVIIPRIAANMTTIGQRVIAYYEHQGVPSVLSTAALQLVRDKYACLCSLQAAQLPIPKTQYVDKYTDLDELFQTKFKFPVIVKLAESTHGHGVLLIRSMQGLRRILKIFRHQQPLLQEFIREAAGSDIRAFVVHGQVVASMKRIAKKGDFRSNLHRGGIGKAIKLSLEEERIVLKAAEVVGIDVAGVDVLQSAKGILILEINASPGLEGIEQKTQKNVAKSIIDYAKFCTTRGQF